MSDRNARLSSEQVRELCSQVVHGVPVDLDPEDYRHWMERGDELNATVARALRRPLLQLVRTVEIPAIGPFSARECIKITPTAERETAEVVYGFLGDDLKGLIEDKLEEPALAGTTLRVHRLCKPSVDGPIIAELGGESVAETTFGQMDQFLKLQGRPDKAVWYIFYIKVNGVLWAVRCYWTSPWNVEASPVAFPRRWCEGRQIVSC